jgi:hypothetical protein
VERAAWTDERFDDRMSAIDTTFQRVFEEMRAERAEFSTEMRELRAEMRAGFAELRAEMIAIHRQVTQIVAGFAIALVGVLAALVVAAF